MSNAAVPRKVFYIQVGDTEEIIHCSSCLAWNQIPDDPDYGECRRRSPHPQCEGTDTLVDWPVTLSGKWCLDAIRERTAPVREGGRVTRSQSRPGD